MNRVKKLEIIKEFVCDYANEKCNNDNNQLCKGKLLGALIMCDYVMEEIANYIIIKDNSNNQEKELIAYDKRDKTFTKLYKDKHR